MDFIENWFGEIVLGIVLCIIIYSQFVFFSGDQLYGIFTAIWAPTILGIYNLTSLKHVNEDIHKIKYRNVRKILTAIRKKK